MRGVIIGVHGSFMSGLASLRVRDDEGWEHILYGDNGPLFRALDGIFGGVIVPGHQVDARAVVGREISYTVDDLGLLESLQGGDE